MSIFKFGRDCNYKIKTYLEFNDERYCVGDFIRLKEELEDGSQIDKEGYITMCDGGFYLRREDIPLICFPVKKIIKIERL